MARRESLSEYGIVRNAIREDVLFFALPAITVFIVGLVVSARDGYDGILATLWHLVRHPDDLHLMSVPNLAGIVIAVVGLTIAFVGVGTLRRFYSSSLVIRRDHQLVTRGIYRFTRHPIYLGVILAVCVGVPVYSSSVYGFLVLSALIPIFLNRIRIEERLLTEQFGGAYRTYQHNTSKLIPFIY